jgi:peptide/nickel transport system permease protein
MTRFLSKRILLMVPILFGVSVVVFLTLKLIPGDPVAALLGPTATPHTRAVLTHRLGLDQALPVQFGHWIWSVLRGDFGMSISRQQPVRPMVVNAFANTLLLSGSAALLALVGGFILGSIGALWRNKVGGRASSAISVIAVSTPQYSVALLLLVMLSVNRTIFPAGGLHSTTGGGGTADLLKHLALPAFSAALAPIGIVARMFRSALIDVMNQDFVESLRARGLSRIAIARHAIHNTLPSLLTITGLQLGYLLGGVVFVETIFSWPGLGLLVFNSIASRDYPIIQAGVLVSAVAFVLINVIVDATHAVVDPRIRR